MLWYEGKPKGDWRSTGTARDLGKYVTDHCIGKLAEIACAKFLETNWKIKSELDFDIHPGSSAVDRGDIVTIEIKGTKKTPTLKIDVKSTKKNSMWAMVDLTEFNNRKYGAYIWIKIDLPLDHLARPIFEEIRNGNLVEIEKLIPDLEEILAEVVGFEYREEVEKWRNIHKGELVYDPIKTRKKLFSAKTDNKAGQISHLRNREDEWNELVQKIVGD